MNHGRIGLETVRFCSSFLAFAMAGFDIKGAILCGLDSRGGGPLHSPVSGMDPAAATSPSTGGSPGLRTETPPPAEGERGRSGIKEEKTPVEIGAGARASLSRALLRTLQINVCLHLRCWG